MAVSKAPKTNFISVQREQKEQKRTNRETYEQTKKNAKEAISRR